jgi:hypothetical protein
MIIFHAVKTTVGMYTRNVMICGKILLTADTLEGHSGEQIAIILESISVLHIQV